MNLRLTAIFAYDDIEKAVVFGAGTIGIAAAIALKYFGCEQVVICDYSDFRLEICKQLGFEIYNNKKGDNFENKNRNRH